MHRNQGVIPPPRREQFPESAGLVPVNASSKVLLPEPIGPQINLEVEGLQTFEVDIFCLKNIMYVLIHFHVFLGLRFLFLFDVIPQKDFCLHVLAGKFGLIDGVLFKL